MSCPKTNRTLNRSRDPNVWNSPSILPVLIVNVGDQSDVVSLQVPLGLMNLASDQTCNIHISCKGCIRTQKEGREPFRIGRPEIKRLTRVILHGTVALIGWMKIERHAVPFPFE